MGCGQVNVVIIEAQENYQVSPTVNTGNGSWLYLKWLSLNGLRQNIKYINKNKLQKLHDLKIHHLSSIFCAQYGNSFY